ncbi:unnamed protein product [Vitrella brassicaformis CCMP3155]|uniref:Uncharacterized protein n=1 Tax=Vitrella brassicaformis (strain CCMP3155) TaxID=1169540 RepID=A0A0G4F9V3_VITBC|nr:unnamed protein product [Vitrella brassicaformis CCMP3155]|eukprot:CEM09690.1 unnamed protein product [Vitrella brassicaformis CCMP3155]
MCRCNTNDYGFKPTKQEDKCIGDCENLGVYLCAGILKFDSIRDWNKKMKKDLPLNENNRIGIFGCWKYRELCEGPEGSNLGDCKRASHSDYLCDCDNGKAVEVKVDGTETKFRELAGLKVSTCKALCIEEYQRHCEGPFSTRTEEPIKWGECYDMDIEKDDYKCKCGQEYESRRNSEGKQVCQATCKSLGNSLCRVNDGGNTRSDDERDAKGHLIIDKKEHYTCAEGNEKGLDPHRHTPMCTYRPKEQRCEERRDMPIEYIKKCRGPVKEPERPEHDKFIRGECFVFSDKPAKEYFCKSREGQKPSEKPYKECLTNCKVLGDDLCGVNPSESKSVCLNKGKDGYQCRCDCRLPFGPRIHSIAQREYCGADCLVEIKKHKKGDDTWNKLKEGIDLCVGPSADLEKSEATWNKDGFRGSCLVVPSGGYDCACDGKLGYQATVFDGKPMCRGGCKVYDERKGCGERPGHGEHLCMGHGAVTEASDEDSQFNAIRHIGRCIDFPEDLQMPFLDYKASDGYYCECYGDQTVAESRQGAASTTQTTTTTTTTTKGGDKTTTTTKTVQQKIYRKSGKLLESMRDQQEATRARQAEGLGPSKRGRFNTGSCRARKLQYDC